MPELTGQVAMITGASRGIGRGIAVEFARHGADVVLVGRDVSALEQTAAYCAAARTGTSSLVISCDVTNRQAVEEAVAGSLNRFGRLDCAVANAGQSLDGLLIRMRDETLDRLLDVNLKSAFHLVSAVARPMMKARTGSIVLVSSVIGAFGGAGQSAYAASKAGLLGLCKSAAKELGSRNIRVNAVAPGLIETAMTEKMPEAARNALMNQVALGRTGTPEDVSGPVVFLCSQSAAYITGQTLVIDGGVFM
jgi:3-oxoacyl-[acyl-carrier protein] reductase